jgi:hypothetical protein
MVSEMFCYGSSITTIRPEHEKYIGISQELYLIDETGIDATRAISLQARESSQAGASSQGIMDAMSWCHGARASIAPSDEAKAAYCFPATKPGGSEQLPRKTAHAWQTGSPMPG